MTEGSFCLSGAHPNITFSLRPITQLKWLGQAHPPLKPKGYSWPYLACRTGRRVPTWTAIQTVLVPVAHCGRLASPWTWILQPTAPTQRPWVMPSQARLWVPSFAVADARAAAPPAHGDRDDAPLQLRAQPRALHPPQPLQHHAAHVVAGDGV
jgi:hypothetical protein